MKGKIIYFGDPMCSWCYGFAPEITKVKEQYEGDLKFELIMGGLRPYGTEKMSELGDMLRHHWEEVAKRSGQPFRFDLLLDEEFIYDTEPSCRAVLTMKLLKPGAEFDFYKRIQVAFYAENRNMTLTQTFVDLAQEFDVNGKSFKKSFEDESIRNRTREEFSFSQNLGVRGFPTTVLQLSEKRYLLANGYSEASIINDAIDRILLKEKIA